MDEGDDPAGDEPAAGSVTSQKPPSKAVRGVAAAVAVAATLFLVWALTSERWHCFKVEVAPSEIYEMFKAIVAILPAGSHPTNFSPALQQKLERSTEPHTAFELQAGLWSASATSLCTPSDAIFSVFVDSKKCQAKLAHFCDDILSDTDPIARQMYERCRRSVRGGGVSMSLVHEPPAKLELDVENEYTTFDGLQSELEGHEQDQDPDLCDTLANCDVLVAMRPLNMMLIAAMMLTTLSMAVASAFFVRALWADDGKHTGRGCNVMLLAACGLAMVIGLDVYIGEKYPLEDAFRTEDLYYFMLPDGSDVQPASLLQKATEVSRHTLQLPELPKRSQRHWGMRSLELDQGPILLPESSLMDLEVATAQAYNTSRGQFETATNPLMQIPPVKWKGALAVLGANLMAALATRNMGAFLDPLKQAAQRAWGKSDVIIDNWLRFLQQSVIEKPNSGGDEFTSFLDGFAEMKSANDVCAKFGTNACSSLVELEEAKGQASKLFSSLRNSFQEKFAQAKKLIQDCTRILSKLKAFWNEVQDPIKRIMALVVEAGTEAGGSGAALLLSVVNNLGKPELLEDIRLLFEKLFTHFPAVVKSVRRLADQFVALVQGLRPLLMQFKDSVLQVRKLFLRGVDKAQVILAEEAESLKSKEAEIKFKIAKGIMSEMNKASAIWGLTEEVDDDEADAEAGASNASSLMERAESTGNLMGLLSNFASAGSLCSPAARIGTIFLSEIQHMHAAARGFETKRGGMFQHFGYITFGLILLFVFIIVGFIMFQAGVLK